MTYSWAARLLMAGAVSIQIGVLPAMAQTPAYYPADYSKMIEASKSEKGVLVYGNIGAENWKPILEAFNKEYPWISVNTVDLGSDEVFQRYYAEQSTGTSNVDIVMSSSSAAWLEFMKKGNAVDYKSAEWDHIPDVARPEAGVYAISFDPIIIAFNKLLLPEAEWPKSLADLSALAQKDPARFTGKLGVQEPMGTQAGVSILAHQIRHVGEEKDMAMFKILGPLSQSYRSAGPTYEKILSGEYLAGFNLSAIPLFPRMSDPNQSAIIGWVYPADGTVAAMRNFAMAPTTKNPNSAKLLIDFILSKTGQESVSAGGLMPFRTDIELAPGNFVSYAAMEAAVGKENLIPSSLDPAMLSPPPELRAKVRAAFNLPN